MKLQIIPRKSQNTAMLICWLTLLFFQWPQVSSAHPADRETIKLEEAFHRIGKKYNVYFNYDRSIASDIQVEYDDDSHQSLEEALEYILKNTNLGYRIFDHRFVVVFENNDHGIESLKQMIGHVQGFVDERETAKKREARSVQRLTTLSAHEVYKKRIVFGISGTVVDDKGEPLIGVNIQVKGTNKGTATDLEGNFTLDDIDEYAVLVVSYVGYQTLEVPVAGKSNLKITLLSDSQLLDEVVVVGYGRREQREIVSSVSTIGKNQLEMRPITNSLQALNGRVPGLRIAVTGGAPGQLADINIRGIGSISAGSAPLFVINGFPSTHRNFESIDPSDIESISVLKDASATAIYGSRGSNGVIIVTTKEGGSGLPQISLRVDNGVSYVPNSSRQDLLNGEEFVEYYTEYFNNIGAPIPNSVKDWDGKIDTDWQDEIYRVAPFQKYHVSASGGNSDFDYYLSGGYTNGENVVKASGLNKYSFRLKGTYHPSKIITLGLSLASNFDNFRNGSDIGPTNFHGNAVNLANLMPPIIPIRNEDGSFTNPRQYLGFGSTLANPIQLLEQYSDKNHLFSTINDMFISINPIEGLSMKSMFGIDYGSNRGSTTYNSPGARNGLPSQSTLNFRQSQRLSWLSQNTVEYKWGIGENHKFNTLGGVTVQSDKLDGINTGISDFGILPPIALAFGNLSNLSASNSFAGNNLISYLGRVDYNFKYKYLISIAGRRDGSSRFGINNRFSNFGSVGLGWRLSEESFIRNIEFVSDAKLRLSYGITGNNQIGDFSARSTLRTTNVTFGNLLLKGVETGTPGSPQLTWEKAQDINIGLDLSFLHYRISSSIDIYDRNTHSLLLSKDLPRSTGFTSILTNIGKMRNRGLEMTLNALIIDQKDFEWSVGGNFAMDQEKVIDINDAPFVNQFAQVIIHVAGKSLYQIQSVKALGILMPGDPTPKAQPNAKPGDIIFHDANDDGKISSFLGPDGVLLGSDHPKIIYGLNTNIKYRNLNLSLLLEGQNGGVVQDFGLIQVATPFQNTNMSKEFWYTGRYKSESQPGDGKTPKPGRFLASGNGAGTVSSLGIQSTDYLRLNNITLSYDFNQNLYSKIKLKGAQVYTSIENLFTITSYIESNNPDKTVAGVRSFTGIINQPLPTIWTFGINAKF